MVVNDFNNTRGAEQPPLVPNHCTQKRTTTFADVHLLNSQDINSIL
jgi:hypothetical protein